MSTTNPIGDEARWDLTALYSGIQDPQIDADLAAFASKASAFRDRYKGKLAEQLGDAIKDFSELSVLGDEIIVYLFLSQSLDVTNNEVKAKLAQVQEALSRIDGEYLTFFTIELVGIDDAALEKAYAENETAKRHRPWIDHARVFKPYLLTEQVESALTKRAPFGPGSWSEFFDECEADLRFSYKGVQKNLTEMLDILSNSQDPAERADALALINSGLGGYFSKYSAQTLYMVAGDGALERKERGYRHPMEGRNKSNRIPDAVVDSLHHAVKEYAGPLARRYYKLKAQLLGVPILAWSDRNAPLPFADNSTIPFNEALAIVLEAYESFSPTLAGIIRDLSARKRIDAPVTKGKRGGAFNYSIVLPGGHVDTFTFLNYLGSSRDVMTLAHELGHGVHGMLAGEAQGPLMFHAPTAFAETASVFGEMTTFNFLKKRLETAGNREALLSLITGKIDDMMNTAVRQIGFSNFERRLHGMDSSYSTWKDPVKLSAEELDAIWLTTTKELYGNDGEIFTYKDTEHLWSYVSHFHRPFYVYGYAFGELLTQSLYARQKDLGDRFEPLYLDLLRAGGTKNASELVAPFGLDPAEETFWTEGIRVSLEALIEEAERLATAPNHDPQS